jgi:hypothetical protein
MLLAKKIEAIYTVIATATITMMVTMAMCNTVILPCEKVCHCNLSYRGHNLVLRVHHLTGLRDQELVIQACTEI